MKNCQVLDDRHVLRESDIAADNQGKEVYFLLNLDGSLPFPGTFLVHLVQLVQLAHRLEH